MLASVSVASLPDSVPVGMNAVDDVGSIDVCAYAGGASQAGRARIQMTSLEHILRIPSHLSGMDFAAGLRWHGSSYRVGTLRGAMRGHRASSVTHPVRRAAPPKAGCFLSPAATRPASPAASRAA